MNRSSSELSLGLERASPPQSGSAAPHNDPSTHKHLSRGTSQPAGEDNAPFVWWRRYPRDTSLSLAERRGGGISHLISQHTKNTMNHSPATVTIGFSCGRRTKFEAPRTERLKKGNAWCKELLKSCQVL